MPLDAKLCVVITAPLPGLSGPDLKTRAGSLSPSIAPGGGASKETPAEGTTGRRRGYQPHAESVSPPRALHR